MNCSPKYSANSFDLTARRAETAAFVFDQT